MYENLFPIIFDFYSLNIFLFKHQFVLVKTAAYVSIYLVEELHVIADQVLLDHFVKKVEKI